MVYSMCFVCILVPEAESKEKHGVWDLMPESTSTHLPWEALCQSRPEPCARVDFIP
jgi:hypothetical protein